MHGVKTPNQQLLFANFLVSSSLTLFPYIIYFEGFPKVEWCVFYPLMSENQEVDGTHTPLCREIYSPDVCGSRRNWFLPHWSRMQLDALASHIIHLLTSLASLPLKFNANVKAEKPSAMQHWPCPFLETLFVRAGIILI
jgi:hypothetical protein